MKVCILTAFYFSFITCTLSAQSITNVRFEQSGKQVIITYNLVAVKGSQWEISVCASNDNGLTWGNNLKSVHGDVGKGINPGIDKIITWDVLTERTNLTGNFSFKVKAEVLFPGEIEMVFVQGGTFQMGSENGESDEKPTHSVTLYDFYISKTEVTQVQWRNIMGNNPSYFKNCDKCPVEQVSWDDIQEFINKINIKTGKKYRLPTEAEWEYSARGGNKSKGFIFSGSNILGEVAWFNNNSDSRPHPVAEKLPNELGIYDMSGNVNEWCADFYGDYSSSAQINPKGPLNEPAHIYRGGSWNYEARKCRSVYRDLYFPSIHNSNLGFRLAYSK
jgi:formylglycine-generating enzyme required for sulfatase activity